MVRPGRIVLPLAVCVYVLWSAAALAYNPPKDTAGPLTVTIEAPATIAEVESPMRVRVVFENKADRAVAGTVRLGVVDRWQIAPAEAVAFEVPAGKSAAREFTLTAGQPTYNAHYPIHAWVKFDVNGKPREAHPILVFEAKLPPAKRQRPAVAWQPFRIAADSELALWRLPVRRAVVQVFGRKSEQMPVGWEGSHPSSRASVQVGEQSVAGQRRECVSIHPPWDKGQVGTAWVEYPLTLPGGQPIALRFSTAMTPHGEAAGDGVTFRVRAAAIDAPEGEPGKVVFERHTAARKWEDCEADLSEFAGKTIRLQLESHPGPKNDTSFDHSFWAEPVLAAGTPAAALPFPPKDTAGAKLLGTLRTTEDRLPPPEHRGEKLIFPAPDWYTVRVWPGRRGLLDATVGIGRQDKQDKLVCFRGFEIRVLGNRLDDPRSPVQLLEVKEEAAADSPHPRPLSLSPLRGGERGEADGASPAPRPSSPDPHPSSLAPHPSSLQFRHKFQSPWGTFDLLGRLWIEHNMLRAKWWLENAPPPQPWLVCRIEDASTGPWSHELQQVYAGHGNVIREPGAYSLSFDGHRLATSFVGFDFQRAFSIVQATDVPPDRLEVRPEQKHFSLHATHGPTFTFVPAENAFDAVKHWRQHNGLKPSSGVEKLAGRFVFDLWGGHYGESGRQLERSFAYGLTDACVVWHNWQRWGYDYRLPDIVPPNPQMGTQEEFVRMVELCRRHGVLFAPHDNYIDFYPDAEGFSYEKQIAFNAGGEPVKAWLNEHRGARSYRYRADTIEPFLRRNVEWIKRELKPTGYFIDVWSSINPYDYWTADGRFFDRVYTNRVWGEQFAWIRQTLGDDAPQISESGQDALVGWVDGAQTNHLRVGKPMPGRYAWSVWNWKCADAERTPWFDAAHHDRFILHGAGYSSRYEAGLESRLHGILSDDYIATEVLDGHPAMVPVAFSRDVVRKYWLTQELMRALAMRTIERVEYVEGDLHRQRVTWSGGGHVWVNRGESDWTPNDLAGVAIPPYGFVANVRTKDGDVTASITRRQGVMTECVVSPQMVYVNGRQMMDGATKVKVTVDAARLTSGRHFELSLLWELSEAVPEEYRPFLHLCDAEGEIVCQAGFDGNAVIGRTGEVRTIAAGDLPASVKPGQALELRMGFYQPAGGARLALVGADDGSRRIRIGSIKAEGQGEKLTGVAWTPLEVAADPWLMRQNPEAKPIDFGCVTTAGAVRITPEKDGLLVAPLPSAKGPVFSVRIIPSMLPWKVPKLTHVSPVGEDGQAGVKRPLKTEGDRILLECEPGVFGYRLTQQ